MKSIVSDYSDLIIRLSKLGIYAHTIFNFDVDINNIIVDDFIRTDLGRILKVDKIIPDYFLVTLYSGYKRISVRIKKESVVNVGKNPIELLMPYDWVYITDFANGIYGKFRYIQSAYFKKTKQIKILVENSDKEKFIVLPEVITDFETLNLLSNKILNNNAYFQSLIE